MAIWACSWSKQYAWNYIVSNVNMCSKKKLLLVLYLFQIGWKPQDVKNEMYEAYKFCQILRQLYAEVRQNNGNKYSTSGD